MWAAGMVGVRLPSMMPGLRMEEGTMASGCLEAWSILEGLLGWAELGQWPELQRVEWASVAEQAERGPRNAREKTPRQERREEDGKKLQVSFQEATAKRKNNFKKINKLNNCSIADLLPKGIV